VGLRFAYVRSELEQLVLYFLQAKLQGQVQVALAGLQAVSMSTGADQYRYRYPHVVLSQAEHVNTVAPMNGMIPICNSRAHVLPRVCADGGMVCCFSVAACCGHCAVTLKQSDSTEGGHEPVTVCCSFGWKPTATFGRGTSGTAVLVILLLFSAGMQ
jgi:hypothetical protein